MADTRVQPNSITDESINNELDQIDSSIKTSGNHHSEKLMQFLLLSSPARQIIINNKNLLEKFRPIFYQSTEIILNQISQAIETQDFSLATNLLSQFQKMARSMGGSIINQDVLVQKILPLSQNLWDKQPNENEQAFKAYQAVNKTLENVTKILLEHAVNDNNHAFISRVAENEGVKQTIQTLKTENENIHEFKEWLKKSLALNIKHDPKTYDKDKVFLEIQIKAKFYFGHDLNNIDQIQTPEYLLLNANNEVTALRNKNNRLISQVTHPLFNTNSKIIFTPIVKADQEKNENFIPVSDIKNIVQLPAGEFGLVYQAEYTGNNTEFQKLCKARPDPNPPHTMHYWFVIKNPIKATDKDFNDEVKAVNSLKQAWKNSGNAENRQAYFNIAQNAELVSGDKKLEIIISPLETYNVTKTADDKLKPNTSNLERFYQKLNNPSRARPEEKEMLVNFNKFGAINNLAILGQVYTGLSDMHAGGWLHLDLAARNIFMSDTSFEEITPGVTVPISFSVRVADPGKAKPVDEHGYTQETSTRVPLAISNQRRLQASQANENQNANVSATSDLYAFRSLIVGETLSLQTGLDRSRVLNINPDEKNVSSNLEIAIYTRDFGDKFAMERFASNADNALTKQLSNTKSIKTIFENFNNYIRNPGSDDSNPEQLNKTVQDDKNAFVLAYKKTFFELLEQEFKLWKGLDDIASLQRFLIAIKKFAALPIIKENCTQPAEKALYNQCVQLASYSLLDSKIAENKVNILKEMREFYQLIKDETKAINAEENIVDANQIGGIEFASLMTIQRTKEAINDLETTYKNSIRIIGELIKKNEKGEDITFEDLYQANLRDKNYFDNENAKINRLIDALNLPDHHISIASALRTQVEKITNDINSKEMEWNKLSAFKKGTTGIEEEKISSAALEYEALKSNKLNKLSYARILHLISVIQTSADKLNKLNYKSENVERILTGIQSDKKTWKNKGKEKKLRKIWDHFKAMDIMPLAETRAKEKPEAKAQPVQNKEKIHNATYAPIVAPQAATIETVNVAPTEEAGNTSSTDSSANEYLVVPPTQPSEARSERAETTGARLNPKRESLPVSDKTNSFLDFLHALNHPLLKDVTQLSTLLEDTKNLIKGEKDPKKLADAIKSKENLNEIAKQLLAVQSALKTIESQHGRHSIDNVLAIAALHGAKVSHGDKEHVEQIIDIAKKYEKFNAELQQNLVKLAQPTRLRAQRKAPPVTSPFTPFVAQIEKEHNPCISGPYNLFAMIADNEQRRAILKDKEMSETFTDLYTRSVNLTADSLIAMDKNFFDELDVREIYRQGEGKDFRPHIDAWTKYFNQVSAMVKDDILKRNTPQERTQAREFWINVANRCRTNPNVQSVNMLLAIHSGLDASSLLRLHQTNNGISPQAQKIYEEDNKLAKSEKSFGALRDAVRNNSTTIPYLGLYLTDFTFTRDGNAPTIEAISQQFEPKDTTKGFEGMSLAYQQFEELNERHNNIATIKFAPTVSNDILKAVVSSETNKESEEARYQTSLTLEPRLKEGETPPIIENEGAIEVAKPLYISMREASRKEKPTASKILEREPHSPLIILNENNKSFAKYLNELEPCEIALVQNSAESSASANDFKYSVNNADKKQTIEQAITEKRDYFNNNKEALYCATRYGKTYSNDQLQHSNISTKANAIDTYRVFETLVPEIKNQVLAQELVNQYNNDNPSGLLTVKDSLMLDEYARDLFINKRYHLSSEKELANEPPLRKVMAAVYLMTIDNGSFFKADEKIEKQEDKDRIVKNRIDFTNQFISELAKKDIEGFFKFLKFLDNHPEIAKQIPEEVKTHIAELKSSTKMSENMIKTARMRATMHQTTRGSLEFTSNDIDKLIKKDPLFYLKGNFHFQDSKLSRIANYFKNKKMTKFINQRVYTHLDEIINQAKLNHSPQTIEYILANRELRDLYRKNHPGGLDSLKSTYKNMLEEIADNLTSQTRRLDPADALLAERNIADRVVKDILSEKSLKHRSLVMQRFIALLEKSYEKNNFTLLMGIYSGLNHDDVAKLKNTINSLSPNARFIMSKMDEWLKHGNRLNGLKTDHLQTVLEERKEQVNIDANVNVQSPFFTTRDLIAQERIQLPNGITEESSSVKLLKRSEITDFSAENKKVLQEAMSPPRQETVEEYLKYLQKIADELKQFDNLLKEITTKDKSPEEILPKAETTVFNNRHTFFASNSQNMVKESKQEVKEEKKPESNK